MKARSKQPKKTAASRKPRRTRVGGRGTIVPGINMARIVETNKNGELVFPREIVDAVSPHGRFAVDVEGNVIVARPVREGQPLWQTLSPKERAEEFGQWLKGLKPKARHLSDEAMRRENMYD